MSFVFIFFGFLGLLLNVSDQVCYHRETLLPIRKPAGAELFRISPTEEINNLETSIAALKKEIHFNDNNMIMTRLDIAFMTGASFDFKFLRPDNLPSVASSIDVWILRGQDILLTKDWAANDQIVNMKFTGFSQSISTTFSQTLTPTVQPFNQGLVIIDQIFQFVKMESNDAFQVNSTADLDQVFRTITQIVDQEINFLSQLKSFEAMLHTANVFTTEAPVSIPQSVRSIVKRNTFTNAEVVETRQARVWRSSIRKVRSLADIFTPYSVSSIGDTANQNYLKMNRNFKSVHVTEQKLAHQQQVLSHDFRAMNTNQKQVARKELFLELRSFKTQSLNNFMFELNQILKTNHLDPTYDIVFELLRDHQFCFSDTCYTLPIFNVIDDLTIQITVQKAVQSLAKAMYISCTILNNQRTSIFSHQVALVNGNTLHFQEDKLPSLNISDLIHPQIDKISRPITEVDLLANVFFPIYSKDKISLQCLNPQFVIIDNEKRYCDAMSLHFIEFPEQISANNISILAAHVPHHFSSKLDFMNTDFRSVSLFRKTNQSKITFAHDVVSFFEQATPIHWSLLIIGFSLTIVSLLLLCCICYLRIPKLLNNILCCFKNTCCLKRRVLTRLTERQHLDSLYTRQNQVVERNYQANNLMENEQLIMSPFPPSCPDQSTLNTPPRAQVPITPFSTPQAESQTTNPPFNKNFICFNNLPDCFCARNYPAMLYECKLKK